MIRIKEKFYQGKKKLSALTERPPQQKFSGQTPFQIEKSYLRSELCCFSSGDEQSILIVPSLINRYTILDLKSDSSLISFFTQQGFSVYLIDWKDPRPQDRFMTWDDHAETIRIYSHHLNEKHGRAPIAMGHCLGGTLNTMLAAIDSKIFSGLINITTPINFHDQGLLSTWSQKIKVDLSRLRKNQGNISGDFLDQAFQRLTPLGKIKKWKQFFKYCDNPEFLERYHAIDEWLEAAVDFPGASYETLIQKLYRENQLIKDQFILLGKRVHLGRINIPTLIVSGKSDHIVPPPSATILAKIIDHSHVHMAGGGHIGLMVGSKAKDATWKPINKWMRSSLGVKNEDGQSHDEIQCASA